MDKPQKPTNLLPNGFGGIKENFSQDRIKTGYEPDVPQIIEGENLNYLINGIGENFEYNNKIADFVIGLPIGNIVTTDENNKLVYKNLNDLQTVWGKFRVLCQIKRIFRLFSILKQIKRLL